MLIGGAVRRVEEVLSDTQLKVAKPFLGTSTQANHRYNRPLFWITEQGRVTIGTAAGSAGLDLHGPLEVGGNLQIGDSLHGHRLDLYSGTSAIDFYVEGGGRYGRISTNASNDFVLQSSAPGGKVRIANDVHFRFSDLGSWQSIHAGKVVANTSLDVTGDVVLPSGVRTQGGLSFRG